MNAGPPPPGTHMDETTVTKAAAPIVARGSVRVLDIFPVLKGWDSCWRVVAFSGCAHASAGG